MGCTTTHFYWLTSPTSIYSIRFSDGCCCIRLSHFRIVNTINICVDGLSVYFQMQSASSRTPVDFLTGFHCWTKAFWFCFSFKSNFRAARRSNKRSQIHWLQLSLMHLRLLNLCRQLVITIIIIKSQQFAIYLQILCTK